MKKKSTDQILGLCFIGILAAVFIINLLVPDKSFSNEENRVLQKLPDFSFSSYTEGRYESKLETYVNDQFLGRNKFIKIKTASDVTTGKLESNGVYRCKDSYLMESVTVPSDKWMKSTVSGLKQFKRHYKNLDMYFLLAPNAANILENKLPAFVKTPDQDKYIDRFYKEISEAGYTPVDVRKTLEKESESVKHSSTTEQTTTGQRTAHF